MWPEKYKVESASCSGQNEKNRERERERTLVCALLLGKKLPN